MVSYFSVAPEAIVICVMQSVPDTSASVTPQGRFAVDLPNPGSDEAIKKGCKCPILDNRHGLGYYAGKDGEFVMVEDCPLHGAVCRLALYGDAALEGTSDEPIS